MSVEMSGSVTLDDRARWSALAVLCLGFLMTTINATVVTIALPSIAHDLRFTDAALIWVVNSYLATFGGFLLLGGRLGDLFGHRRILLLGITLFCAASVGCAIASSPEWLVAARAVQGIGGAIVSTVARTMIVTLFTDVDKRAKALGISAFVGASGGSIGLLLGGVLASMSSWRWIFLANALLGATIYAWSHALLPSGGFARSDERLDWGGAVTATAALVIASYAISNGNLAGWGSAQTLTLFASTAMLLTIFVAIEQRVQVPLLPLQVIRRRSVIVANLAAALLAAAVLAWNVILGLYLQRVLHFNPLQVGVAFLPANLLIGVMSLSAAPRLVVCFGCRGPLVLGLLTTAAGLAVLARAPLEANVLVDVLPGMLLIGFGAGMAYNPLVLSAFGDVAPADTGAASGIMNTSFAIGGALGLTVLMAIASARTDEALVSGATAPLALVDGYQAALAISAAFAATAALIVRMFLRQTRPAASC